MSADPRTWTLAKLEEWERDVIELGFKMGGGADDVIVLLIAAVRKALEGIEERHPLRHNPFTTETWCGCEATLSWPCRDALAEYRAIAEPLGWKEGA